MIKYPQRSLSSQSLGKYWQLNQNIRKTEHIQTQTNKTQKGALITSKTHFKIRLLKERTDKAWFSHLLRNPARKWSGSVLSTRSPHEAIITTTNRKIINNRLKVSEWVGLTSLSTHYRSFWWRLAFPVNHFHWYWQPNKNNQETEYKTQHNATQKVAIVDNMKHNQKKPRLRERTDGHCFSCLLRHPAREQSGSIISTRSPQCARVPEPAQGNNWRYIPCRRRWRQLPWQWASVNSRCCSLQQHSAVASHHPVPTDKLSLSLSLSQILLELGVMEVVSDDNCSCKTCKAPVKMSPPTNQHPVFLQAGCPSCRPTNSVKALKGNTNRHLTSPVLPVSVFLPTDKLIPVILRDQHQELDHYRNLFQYKCYSPKCVTNIL